MKRIIVGVMAALLLFTGNGVVRAEEGAEVEAGVKLWYNKWEIRSPDFGTIRSDYTMLIGPAAGVRFPNRLFLDGSFLFSTSDYKLSDLGEKWRREDLELAVGYMIVDEFGLFAGYKNLWLKETDPGVDLKESLYGPMVGAVLNAPVNEPFSIYGNLNYLFTKFKLEGEGGFTEDSPGWIVEIGVKYRFTKHFVGNLAYRYETTKGKDSDVRDTFTGLTLGALYAF